MQINRMKQYPSKIIVMGVSGVGKTTVGKMLAEAINFTFLDADDYHSAENKEKMALGVALNDNDRIPWLMHLKTELVKQQPAVLACSALKPEYRMILEGRSSLQTMPSCCLFVYLHAAVGLVAERLREREKTSTHFMPSSLLQSQIDSLSVDPSESNVLYVEADQSPKKLVELVIQKLSSLPF